MSRSHEWGEGGGYLLFLFRFCSNPNYRHTAFCVLRKFLVQYPEFASPTLLSHRLRRNSPIRSLAIRHFFFPFSFSSHPILAPFPLSLSFFPSPLLFPSSPLSLPITTDVSCTPTIPHLCRGCAPSLSGMCPAFACLACIGGNQRSQRQAEIHAAKRGDSAASRASHEWRQCNEGKKVHTTQQTSQKPPPPLRVTRCFTAVALLGPRSAFRARLSEGRPPPLLGFQSRAPCCSLGVPNHRVRSSRGATLQ